VNARLPGGLKTVSSVVPLSECQNAFAASRSIFYVPVVLSLFAFHFPLVILSRSCKSHFIKGKNLPFFEVYMYKYVHSIIIIIFVTEILIFETCQVPLVEKHFSVLGHV
jgi:hypothetical protein